MLQNCGDSFPETVPDWVPQKVFACALKIKGRHEAAETWDIAKPIVLRLLLDGRMKTVWQTLLRRKRSRGYQQATERPYEFPTILKDEAGSLESTAKQFAALAAVFEWAFAVVFHGLRATTEEAVNQLYSTENDTVKALKRASKVLYDYELFYEAVATRDAAEALEKKLAAKVSPGDMLGPGLISQRASADPWAKGTAIAVAQMFLNFFGSPMERLSKIVAEVALGREVPLIRINKTTPPN